MDATKNAATDASMAAATMKLVHLSDLHLTAPGTLLYGSDPAERLARALTLIRRDHADATLCLLTGDLANAGHADAYAELARQLVDFPVPCHLIPGNHDDRAAMCAAFPTLLSDSDGFLQQSLSTPVGRFLLLDTLNVGRASGRYDEARAGWLRAQLESAREQPVFIAMHHPPFAVGIPSMDRYALRNTTLFEAALAGHESRIRHLFIGHLHRPIAGSWRGIPISGISSPNHQVALDLVSCAPSGDVPGCPGHPGFGVVLIDAERVIVHHQFLHDDDERFAL
jgi:3',5'-cyclic AMP phosphodiesterase CpdA